MQEDQNKEFDQLLRSMLSDAQEEVPSRVWDSVSKGLDRRRRTVVLRRSFAGIAAAAAVLAGVVLLRNNSTLPYIQDGGEVFAVVEDASSSPAVPAGEEAVSTSLLAYAETPETTLKTSAPAGEIRPAGSFDVPVPAEEATPQENLSQEAPESAPASKASDDKASEVSDKAPQASDKAAASGKPSPAKDAATSWTDPFAGGEPEVRNSGRRPQIQAGSNLFGNGNPSSTGFAQRNYSSGKGSSSETSIRQTSKESTYSIPLSFGLGVRFPLTNRLSLGTGIEYSRLERTFTGVYSEISSGSVVKTINADMQNTLHYIGVPVYLYYNLHSGERMSFYTFGGGVFEKAVGNRYRIPDGAGDIHYHTSVDGIQFSAAAGFGAEFLLAPRLSFYVDPSLRYYFDCDQPVSIRTQQPFTIGFEIGLRLGL